MESLPVTSMLHRCHIDETSLLKIDIASMLHLCHIATLYILSGLISDKYESTRTKS
jgi:hypothetical protein